MATEVKPRRAAKPAKPAKVTKGYHLPLDLVIEYDTLAARRQVPPCRLVEEALRGGLKALAAKE